MPIYEYQCKKCGADFEELRARDEMDKRRACPKCKSRATRAQAQHAASPWARAPAAGGFGDDFDFGDEMGGPGRGDDGDDFDDF